MVYSTLRLRVLIFMTVATLLGFNGAYAQVTNGYAFSQTSGTYTPIAGTTVNFSGVTTTWNNNTVGIAFPFNFTFNGITYASGTNFYIYSNGFLDFSGSGVNPGGAIYAPVSAGNNFDGDAGAMGCHLVNNGVAISYTTLGTAPNRSLVIQWSNARRIVAGNTLADNLNFQIILYETTNAVQFVYGPCTASDTLSGCQVGLRGVTKNDFTSRTSGTAWASTTSSVTNTDSISIVNTIVPASGLTFTYTPCSNSPLTLPVSQGFNSTTAPTCWNTQFVSGVKTFSFLASSANPATTPQEGSDYVLWNSRADAATSETRLVSPPISTTGTSKVEVNFYWYAENSNLYNSGVYPSEGATLEYSTDNATWNSVQFFPRQDTALAPGAGAWVAESVDLPAGAGNQPVIYVAWDFLSEHGDNCSMDNVVIEAAPANDAGVSGIVVPAPLNPASQPIEVTITNYGSATLTSVTVNWSVNGTIQTPVNFTGLSVPTDGSVTEYIGNYTFSNILNPNSVTACTTNPNGAADGNVLNDCYTNANLFTCLSGTYTVGVGQNFPTLTSAINYANSNGICGPTIFSLTDANYSTSETFPITLNNITSATNTLTIQAATGVTANIVSSATAGILDINGAGFVTINGGTGTQRNLVFNSSGIGAYDIQTNTGCLGIAINNCALLCNQGYNIDIEGTGTGSTTVSNCDLHDYSTGNYPLVGIYNNNKSSQLTVTNSNIYNFTKAGIQLIQASDACVIGGNNMWYAGTASTQQVPIYVESGSGHKIYNNTIGGQSTGGGLAGSPWVNSADASFPAIWVSVFNGAGNPDTIYGNTVQNINLTNVDTPSFYGILINGGRVIVGYSGAGNTIGSNTSNLGIVNYGVNSAYMQGIWAKVSNFTAQYNTVANLSAPSANAPGATNSTVGGIFLSNASNGTIIANNLIHDLSNASPDTVDMTRANGGYQFNVQGIIMRNKSINHAIQNNTIYNLSSTNTGPYYTAVVGIGIDSSGNGAILDNLIYGLSNTSTGTSSLPGIVGIRSYQGGWNVYNNQIILTNGTNTNGVSIFGISDMTGNSNNYFYNSVYIGGSPNTGSGWSAAWNMVLNASTGIILRDNLLDNVRANNGSASGKNYAIALAVATAPGTFSSDYNDLYSSGTAANFIGLKGNAGSGLSFTAWKAAYSGGDAHSQNGAVVFNQSNPPVSDLTPNSLTNCFLFQKGTPIVTPTYAIAVPNDYNNTVRNATTPDIGAIEFTDSATAVLTISSGASSSTTGITVCAGSSVTNSTTTNITGTPTYSWSTPDAFNPGNNAAFTRTVTTAMAGTYTVSVTDASGCSTTASVSLTVNPQPAFTTTQTNVTCNGLTNGQITLTVTAGVSPFSYSVNGGSSYAYSASPITGLGAATYNVVVKDVNGCTSNSSVVTITQPAALTAPVITNTNVTCNGLANGTITVSTIPTGGTTPYTYSLNGGTYQSSTSFTAQAPGSYTVSAKDANGCTIGSNSVTITQPAALTAPAITFTNVTCHNAANGTITVSTLPTGGTTPYQYSLNGGAYQSSTSFTGLGPATYTVVAKDANGCISSASNPDTILQSATALAKPVTTSTNVSCYGGSNGTIVVTMPTTGTAPYQYSLNGGAYQSSLTFSGLPAGRDSVVTKDAYGCISAFSTTKVITQPTALTAPVITSTNVACNGASTGVETVSTLPTGGTSPYTYSLNGGTYQSSTTFSGLPAQVDVVTAKDANGCTILSNSDTITQPSALVAPVATPTAATCFGTSTGSISATKASGGTPYTASANTYKYTITAPTGYGNARTFTALAAGTYTVTAKDSLGCTVAATPVTITQPTAVTAPTITATNVSCNGGTNGTVTVSTIPTGGTPGYKYSISGTYQTSVNFTTLAAGSYTVTAEDANLCTVTSNTINVTQPAALTAPVITGKNDSCSAGHFSGEIDVTTIPTGGTTPYQYSINGSGYQTSTAFTGFGTGTYTVTAKDANGCTIASNSVTLTVPNPLTAPVISVTTNVLCFGASTGKITVTTLPTGGTSPYEYTLNGGTIPYQDATAFAGLAANSYTVTAKDTNGCAVAGNTVTVTQPATALTAGTGTPTNVTCNGANNGSIVYTAATGGVSPYRYSFNGGGYGTLAAKGSPTGLAPGTYTFSVDDNTGAGCVVAYATVTITQPAVLTAAVITGTNVTCNGAANGTITVSTIPTGGTAPYQYSLNGGAYQSSTSFTGVLPGSNTVTTKDANGCTSTSNSVTITQPAVLTAAVITSTNVTCNGAANGTVTVSTIPTGGTSPYQYSLNGGPYQSGTSFTGLTPNSYIITTKDANGCTSTSNSVTITQPAVLTAATISSTNVSCNGAANGTVTVSTLPTGGTSPYQYSINGGTTYQSGTTFSGLTPNTYAVTSKDANGCTSNSNSITITQPSTLTAPVITSTNVSCNGGSNGTITVGTIPTGGTSPYQYSINGGGSYQSSTSFTGLTAASYTVTAKDANGCTIASNSQNVTQPVAFTAPVISSTNVTCNGSANGTVTVSTIPTGGTGPYQYSLNSGAYQSSVNFTSLSPNNYSVTAQDANNCTISSNSVTISQPSALTAPVISSTNVSCNGAANGTITVGTIPTGGTTPYQYSVNGTTYQSGTSFSGLAPATYAVTAKDANGCTIASNSTTITQPAALTAPVITSTNVNCNGSANGTITVSTVPTGGTSPYQYSIDGVTYQSSTSFTGLAPGTYTVTAQDANNCTIVSNSKTITQPSTLSAPVIISSNVNCYGASNGIVTITTQASGGTSPYLYALNSGSYQSAISFTGLGPNSYVVTAKDANNCTVNSNSVTITQPTALTAPVISSTNLTCNGNASGTITVNTVPTGGTSPYQFSLNGTTYQTSTSFTGLAAGTYTVTAKDANVCTIASNTVTITQPTALTAPVITKTNVLCRGAANGTITVSTAPTGGTSPYQFSLNGVTFQSGTGFTGVAPGTYSVTAEDANNCSIVSNSVTITQPTALTAPVITVTNVSCNGATTGTATVSTLPTGGTSPYQYSLNGSPYQSSTSFTGLAAGTYTLTAEDANNCTIASASKTITQPAALTAPVITNTNVSCNGGSNGVETVSTLPTGGVSPYQYSLNHGTYQSSVTFSGLPAQIDTVIAKDANGCLVTSNIDTITQPTAISTPVATPTNITCNGAANGQVVSSVPTGGNRYASPNFYRYSLNGGAYGTARTFTGLGPGSYIITVRDQNLCTVNTNSVTITQPAVLTAPVATSTNVTCNGAANGTITVSTVPTGGTSPYQYALNNGTYQSSVSFTGLGPNTDTVYAKDANGCVALSNIITITQPAVLTVPVITGTNLTCNGNASGVITVSTIPTGGTTPYQYSLNGSPYQSSTSFTGLAAGTYTLTAEDANNCTIASTSKTITQPVVLTVPVITSTDVSCFGGTNGIETVSTLPTGGTSPYQYSLNHGTYQSSATFSGLPAQIDTVIAKDANGCTVSSNFDTITQPTALVAGTTTAVNVTCNGAANGSVTTTKGSGGTPYAGANSYRYSLNGGAFGTARTFTGLAPGTYTITQRDQNLCVVNSNTVTITQPAVLTAPVATSTNVTCNGAANGTITVGTVPTGGTSPYQYALNNGTYQSSVSFTGLVPNTDTVYAKDANGCIALSNIITITQPAVLTTPVITGTNLTCNGNAGGVITVSTIPTGGTTPYQYSDGGAYQSSGSFTGLAANAYTVTVQDANSCSAISNTVTLTQPAALSKPTITVQTEATCNGLANGTLHVTSTETGGTPPYEYALNSLAYQSSVNFTGLAAGTYTCVVKDTNGCLSTASAARTITQPAALTAPVITSTNINCFGAGTGTITVSTVPTGGTSPYQYSDGGAYQSSTSFTAVAAGSYTVIAEDANSCTISSNSVTITQPATALTAPVITGTNLTCNANASGVITVSTTPTGGTAPYQYSDGGAYQSSVSFTGLAANSYTVTVQDANSCTVTSNSVTLTQPAALLRPTITVQTEVTCNGLANGTLHVTSTETGGTPPYEYVLTGGTYQSSVNFTGLAAGTYTCVVKDTNGCLSTASAARTITQPAALTAPVITGTNPVCNGGTAGTITVSTIPTRGTSPYTYSLNGGAYQSSTSFTGLIANIYQVTAQDANSCTVASNADTLTQPAALSRPTITVQTEVSCFGGSTGSIKVTSTETGGTSPYQYSLGGGPYQSSINFTGLIAGTYSVRAEDVNGCTSALSLTKTITQPAAALTAPVITSTDVNCYGASTGVETVSTIPTGGTSPYTYSLNGGAYQSSTTFSGLPAQIDVVTAQDANGCTITSNSDTITQPASALTAPVITGTNLTCNGNATGTITVSTTPTGGTSPYQYSLNSSPYQSSTSFTGLAAIACTVTAQDANGCTINSNSVTLTQPAALTAPGTAKTNVTCNGAGNGSVSVTTLPTGGTTPYQYSINGTYQSGTSFTNLTAGTYTITAEDANGCTVAGTARTISTPAALTTPVITVTNVLCNGAATGTATVSTLPTGGTSPYQYTLNSGSYQSSTSFTGLTAGPYVLTAKDANGCTINSASKTITQPSALTVPAITATNATCSSSGNGTITVTTVPTGGVSPYQYSDGGAYQSSTSFTSLTPATYTVTAQDANNCTTSSNTVTITQPAVLSAPVISATNVSCNGASDGTITVNTSPTGGTSPYKYSVNGVAYQSSISFTGLANGSYTITAEDNNNCTVASNTVTITQPAALTAPVLTATNVSCNGAANGTLTVSTVPTGGTSPYQYSDGGAYQSSTSFTALANGSYTVTAQDANGCTVASGTKTITQPAALTAPAITATTNVVCFGGSTGVITVSTAATGGTSPYKYSLGGAYQSSTSFTGLSATSYTVTAQDANGCSVTGNSVTLTQPATALTAGSGTPTNIACYGAANGSIVFTAASGGVTPYRYSFNGGAYGTLAAKGSPTGLAPGTYTFSVQDATGTGCVVSYANVTITQPASAITAPTITATNVKCNGAANGTITVSTIPSGGTPGYKYSINGSTFQASTNFTALANGSYTITAEDANLCTVTSNTVTITQPAALSTPVITGSTVSCTNHSDGVITVSTIPTGGTSPYQYAISGGYQSSTSFTGLTTGSYTVTAEDANNCTVASNTASVTSSTPLGAPVITGTNPTCSTGNTGAVTVTTAPTGGATPYKYSLNGSAYQTSTSFSSLAAGSYSLTAEDNNGCSVVATSSVTLTAPTALTTPTGTITNLTCNGVNTGKIVSSVVTGGTGTIKYSITGTFSTARTFSNLSAGTYTITAEDANLCTVTSTVQTVTQPAVLVSPTITATNVTCNGSANGIVTVSTLPTGGTTPYQYSLNGGAYQSSTSFTALPPTSYTVTVKDANACATVNSNTVTITQPAALTAPVIGSTNISCNGANSGTVTVSTVPTGGTSPYQYSLNSGAYQSSVNFTGLTTGSYTVTAKDANGCTLGSNTTNISQAAALTNPVITAGNVTCHGASNGTITVSTIPTGGNAPYTYSLNGGAFQSSTAFTGQAPGSYTVVAQDASNCSVTSAAVSITQPTALTSPVIATNNGCFGANNGTVTVSTVPTGGTSPYQFSLNGVTYQSGTTFTGLSANTYTVTAKDANGCTITSNTASFTAPTALTAPVLTQTSVTCNGGTNGAITVSTATSGGTSPYQYAIASAAYQSGLTFTGLSAGSYTVTAQDANGCTVTSSATSVTQPAALTTPVGTVTNVTCNGANNGKVVSTTVTGGTGTKNYSLNGGAYQTSKTFANLAPGNYTIVARDANLCLSSTSAQVTVTQPAALTTPVITAGNITCNGSANGTVTVSTIPTGGTSPYQFSLNGTTYQSGTSFTSLNTGTYSVTAQDANNCSAISNSVTITQPAALTNPVISSTNASCNGSGDGTVTVNTIPTGGTSPYTYSLNGGAYQSSTSFASLATGSYTVSAKDANSCTIASNTVTVSQPAALTNPVITATNVTCNGAANGTVTVSTVPTGGTSPYQYSLNGGAYQSSTSFAGLGPVSNTVMAKDANGCTISSNTVTITQPAALTNPVITATNVTCNGSANGTITVSTIPTGGTSPYNYSLNGGAYQSSTSFTGVGPVANTVMAKDANGCTIASNTVTVTQPAALTNPVITASNITCNGLANGTVTVSTVPTGGTSPYQYSLNGGAYQSSTSFTGVGPVASTVMAKDANGCTIASNTVTVTQPAALTNPVISSTNSSCNGSGDGTVTVNTMPTGGTSPYTYSLNGSAYQSSTSFASLATGSYTVSAKDANSCTVASNTVTVSQPTVLTTPVITVTNVTCNGAGNGSVTVSTLPTGGSSPYQYSLNGGAYQSSTIFNNEVPNSYIVTAKDANGCTVNSASKTITEPAALTAPAITVTDVTCNGAANGKVTVSTLPTGGTGPYTYSLNSGSYQSGTTFNNQGPNNYFVTAKDANGCTIASASQTLTEPAALTAPILTATDVTCNGKANGTITVSTLPTGGTSPYSYQLNSGSYQSGTTFNNLAPNSYTVTAKDASGCTVTSASDSVTQPAVLTASASNGGPYNNGQMIQLTGGETGGTANYSYHWSGQSGAYSTNIQSPSIASASSAASGVYTVVVTDGAGCTASASTNVIVSGNIVYTWTGATSTDWGTPGNWTPSSPIGGPTGCNTDVVIQLETMEPVISSLIYVANMHLNANAEITLNANLDICNSWTGGSGGPATVLGTGVVVFNGSTAQTISGITQFNEVQLDNAAGATLAAGANMSLVTALDLQLGQFDASAGNLTFLSADSAHVAIIDNFSPGFQGTLVGSINAQRYYGNAVALSFKQHFMGSPVNSPSLSAQLGATGASGYVTPKSDCDETQMAPGSNYGTVFSYHEENPNAAICGEYQWYVENGGAATNGQGYSVVLNGTGTLTLRNTANLNSSYTLNGLTNSNWSNTSLQNRHMSSGWHLMSDPYLATLNIQTTNPGFDNQIQVWQADGPLGGTYQAGMVGEDAIVAPFQAFMVHRSTADMVGMPYTINASDRVRTAAVFYAQNDNELHITAQNIVTGLMDKTMVAFNSHATNDFDPAYDADKFAGALTRHTLYTLIGDRWISRNILNSINTTSTVPVGFEPGVDGNYAFNFSGLNTFDPTTYIYLEDKQQNVMYNLRKGDYLFTSAATDNWERFVLHFTPPVQISTIKAGCSEPGTISIVQPGPATWSYILTDEQNNTISSGTLNQSAPISAQGLAGNYTLKLVDANNYTVVKTITINGAPFLKAAFTAPATATMQHNVQFVSNSPNADEFMWSFGDGSIINGTANTSYSYAQPGTYTVTLTVGDSAGCSATYSQVITVTSTTGISNVTEGGDISMWSYRNKIYVDFTQLQHVDALIRIYNVLGQEIGSAEQKTNTIYQNEINDIDAAYVIVSVVNNEQVTTRKLFIVNTK